MAVNPLGHSTVPPLESSPSDTENIPKATTTAEKILWSGIWFIVLLLSCFISWFICGVWIIIMPLETFWEPLIDFNKSLQQIIMWPRILGVAFRESHMQFTHPLETTA